LKEEQQQEQHEEETRVHISTTLIEAVKSTRGDRETLFIHSRRELAAFN